MTFNHYTEGMLWEVEVAERLGGRTTPGSGNKWHSKLDVHGDQIHWSCKWTGKDWQPITKDIWEEAAAACDGIQGSDRMPGLALRSAKEDLVVLRMSDFIQMIQQPPTILATKTQERVARTQVPLLLRDD